MLKKIRDTRLSMRTTVIVLVLALAMWIAFAVAGIADFVPEEFRQDEPQEETSR
jgi:hypothetical protein